MGWFILADKDDFYFLYYKVWTVKMYYGFKWKLSTNTLKEMEYAFGSIATLCGLLIASPLAIPAWMPLTSTAISCGALTLFLHLYTHYTSGYGLTFTCVGASLPSKIAFVYMWQKTPVGVLTNQF